MAKQLAFDKLLFTTVVGLMVFGLVLVYSATAFRGDSPVDNPLFVRQCIAAGAGLVAMAVLMHVDYRLLSRPPVVYALVGGAVLLLVAVLFQPEVLGSRRWFRLGPLSLQPSELAKLAIIPYLAYQIDRKEEQITRAEFLVPTGFVVGLMLSLILLAPDLGTTALLVFVSGLMIFLAGLPLAYIGSAAVLGAGALGLLIAFEPYRRSRMLAFLDPESDPLGKGYQALQSLIAIGSGGIFGQGLGTSAQKLYFLPQPESDFILSIAAEELGLFGSLALLVAFGLILWRGTQAGFRAPDRFGRYLAWGLTLLLVTQALINFGVATSLLPTTGMTLPFVSYGGSSLVVAMAAAGILLNISEHG